MVSENPIELSRWILYKTVEELSVNYNLFCLYFISGEPYQTYPASLPIH